MQLYINEKPAIIKKGTSIKLTRENPAITQSGDYTLDVTLPLSGCKENLAIFGPAHYRAASPQTFAGKSYPFYLNAGKIQLSGTAIVTQISDEEIKLQLLAGNSELNFDNREEGERYIDELDIGLAYDEEWKTNKLGLDRGTQNPKDTARLLHSLASLIQNSERADQLMHGTNEQTNCVLFPIYSTSDGAFSNRQEIQYFVHKDDADRDPVYDYIGYRFSLKSGLLEYLPNSHAIYPNLIGNQGLNFTDDMSFAPQPYLCFILERVLAAVGYELKPTDNCMRQGWLGKIFIANARETIEFCECLPHWTVQEFLTELRNAFGVIIYAEGKKCRAVSRSSIYSASNIKELHNVIDERNVEITEDGDNQGSSSGNVSYNHSEAVPNRLNIGSDPYENMEVKRVYNNAQFIFNSMLGEDGTPEEKEKIANSSILFYETYTGRRYGCFNASEDSANPRYELREVDQLGPLFRDDTFDEGTALNIVPAFMGEDIPTHRHRFDLIQVDLSGTREYHGTFNAPSTEEPTQEEGGDKYGFFVPYLITTDSRTRYTRSKFSLQKYLQDGEGITESSDNATRDIMEVAVNAGEYTCKWNSHPDAPIYSIELTQIVPHPIGSQYMLDRMDADNIKKLGGTDYFSLHSAFGSEMKNNLNGNYLKFDSRIVHQFSFTDQQIDPTALYLINGRRFACQKLELTIDEDGLQPLIKGYFFELQ